MPKTATIFRVHDREAFLLVHTLAINQNPTSASVADADRIECEAFAAIGVLAQRETDAAAAWIASGCEGPEPMPDPAERERLSSRLSAAIEARHSAGKAAGGREREGERDISTQAACPSGALRRAQARERAA